MSQAAGAAPEVVARTVSAAQSAASAAVDTVAKEASRRTRRLKIQGAALLLACVFMYSAGKALPELLADYLATLNEKSQQRIKDSNKL